MLYRLSVLRLLSVVVLVVWSQAAKPDGTQACDRLCQTKEVLSVTPVSLVVSEMHGQLESWANLLLTINDAPTYKVYMAGFGVVNEARLDRYLVRYSRRQLSGEELNALHQNASLISHALVTNALTTAQDVDQQQMEAYIKRLMWVRMRETRRYLVERLDTAYGLSRLRARLRQLNQGFVSRYMVSQVEAWMFPDGGAMHSDAKKAINRWLRLELDQSDSDLQAESYRQSIDLLTFLLKNISDEEIRDALVFYESARYQKLLATIEKAMDLHYQRLVLKNNLSDPAT